MHLKLGNFYLHPSGDRELTTASWTMHLCGWLSCWQSLPSTKLESISLFLPLSDLDFILQVDPGQV